jgi:hypothetical protein
LFTCFISLHYTSVIKRAFYFFMEDQKNAMLEVSFNAWRIFTRDTSRIIKTIIQQIETSLAEKFQHPQFYTFPT